MRWNIIWQVDPDDVRSCVERDWFSEITSLVPVHSVRIDYRDGPLLTATLPCPIVGVSCPNQTPRADLIEYLRRLPRPRVLYHMSDEYLEVGSEVYEHCDLVIRNGSANFAMQDGSGFLQLPQGYASGFRNPTGAIAPASQRRSSFAFMGTPKNERETEMLPALSTIPGPHFVRRTDSFASATRHFNSPSIMIYKNSVFVPNPKGNWNPECLRLYDALEWGCIPLIRRYDDSEYHRNYHDRLLGEHPIPTFDDWKQAADFAARLLADKPALDVLQAKIFGWWQGYKAGLQAKVAARLAALVA